LHFVKGYLAGFTFLKHPTIVERTSEKDGLFLSLNGKTMHISVTRWRISIRFVECDW